jgi:hypothetical protein
MTDYTTIRVTEQAKEQADESKRDSETWDDYLQRCTDNPPEEITVVESEGVETIANRLDDLESQLPRKVAEELEGRP